MVGPRVLQSQPGELSAQWVCKSKLGVGHVITAREQGLSTQDFQERVSCSQVQSLHQRWGQERARQQPGRSGIAEGPPFPFYASPPSLRAYVPGLPAPTCWYWRSASSSPAKRALSSSSGWYEAGT